VSATGSFLVTTTICILRRKLEIITKSTKYSISAFRPSWLSSRLKYIRDVIQYPVISLRHSRKTRRVPNPTFDQQFNIMPQPRRPLGEISGNIPKRRELTLYERGQIIGAAKCSVKPSAICTELSLSRRTVQTTIDSEPLRKNGASQPQSGRPRTYSERDERLLLRVVRQFPKYTYAQLRAFTGLKLCNSTL
jgi:hypothetical protein